jgi:hypothetical protein
MLSNIVFSVGNENIYIIVILSHLDAKFEVVTELTIYYPHTGRYEIEETGREIADDEDEAIEAATDLEWAAFPKPWNASFRPVRPTPSPRSDQRCCFSVTPFSPAFWPPALLRRLLPAPPRASCRPRWPP